MTDESPEPLALISKADPKSVTPSTQSRLNGLATLLQRVQGSVLYIDYQEAERACEELAVNILRIYSRQELESFTFTPLPRGGFIVLGMLSYILDLHPTQLDADLDSSNPLVIVDDCALSGHRFADFLLKTTSSHVVFAHLYSHPELRTAILASEPRVKHCIAAQDLVDHSWEHARELAEHQAWLDRWQQRLGPKRYWLGEVDPICFAWSEPEHLFWNEAMEQVQSTWQFLPPHLCLKNKWSLGLPPKAVSKREWQAPPTIISGWFDLVLWLCNVDKRQVCSLQDVAADIWRTLAVYGDEDAAVEYLLGNYEIDEGTLRDDLRAFANELLGKGLLERANGSSSVES